MYLTARLIALIIYCVLLVGACVGLDVLKNKRLVLASYLIILSVMGFLYVPDYTADLYRLWIMFEHYAHMSFLEIFSEIQYLGTPLVPIYFHCVGYLKNPHWLPAINAFFTFLFCFTILYKASRKYELSGYRMSIVLFFFMSYGLLMPAITNLRTSLALSIVCYCIYREIFDKISILYHIPLWVIAILLHTSAMVMFLIYILFFTFLNLFSIKKFQFLIQNIVILVAGSMFGGFYLQKALIKGQNYLEASIEGTAYFYIWELIICLFLALTTLGIIGLFVTAKPWFKRQLSFYENRFLLFMSVLAIINLLAFCVEYTLGVRINFALLILDIPLLAMILSNATLSRKRRRLIQGTVLIAGIILLGLVCSRGSLCSIKFFE